MRRLCKEHQFFIIFLIGNLFLYGNFVLMHYAADTYLTEVIGWKETIQNYWANGRWLMVLFLDFCEIVHMNFRLQQFISWGMGVFSVTAAEAVLYRFFCDSELKQNSKHQRFWIGVGTFLLISNLFLLEDFIFAEYTGIMCSGILFDVLGGVCILKFLKEKETRYYILGILFGILGINGHQGNFAILIVVCILGTKDTFDDLRLFIRNNIVIGSAYLIPALVNIIETRIGGATRVAKNLDMKATFLKTTEGLYNLTTTTANMMPRNVYIFFICGFAIYFFYEVIKSQKWKALLYGGYYCVIVLLGIYAPYIMTDVNAIDVVPRTTYILGAIIPIILLTLLLHIEINWKKNIFVPLFIGCFVLMQYRGTLRMEISHFQTNELDRYEAIFIGNKLWQYEEETGNKVTKMALYWDKNVTGNAPETVGYGAVNERAFCNEWAAPMALQCLDGTVLRQTETSDKVYEKYFKDKDWNYIEEDQMVIIGDTLHLCAY